MAAIGTPQHWHAMTVVLAHNDVPSGIERNTPRLKELPVPCPLAAHRMTTELIINGFFVMMSSN